MFDADAWLAEQAGESFVSFRLGGEEFHVINPLPAWPGMKLARDQSNSIESWAEFLRAVVVDDEAEEKRSRIDDAIQRSGISAKGLMEIAKTISQESWGRPTTRQSDSSDLPPPTGTPSKRRSRSTSTKTRPTSLRVAS